MKSKEDLQNYLEYQEVDDLHLALRPLKINEKEFYNNLPKDELDRLTNRDLHDVLSLNLWELKLSIEYDLQLKENESDEAFWTFFANPTYRIHEKNAAKNAFILTSTKKSFLEKSIY